MGDQKIIISESRPLADENLANSTCALDTYSNVVCLNYSCSGGTVPGHLIFGEQPDYVICTCMTIDSILGSYSTDALPADARRLATVKWVNG